MAPFPVIPNTLLVVHETSFVSPHFRDVTVAKMCFLILPPCVHNGIPIFRYQQQRLKNREENKEKHEEKECKYFISDLGVRVFFLLLFFL